ncbi:MAG: DNA polymerase III subunit beta [Oscillospiraceae bacterium]|nr:DNA polymerase III subunit beta [Oscillospiraceae bacterium]
MKFTCEKLLLLAAILTASRAVSSKSPVPVLEGLLIEASFSEGAVNVSGYDLKMGIVSTVPAEVASDGEIVLNARLFAEIIRKLPGETVTLQINEEASVSSVVIKSEFSVFEILGSAADDFPELPKVEDGRPFEVSGEMLKKMISQTNFAVSDNESRPIHTGALFETGKELTIVAVDGYRLALRRETMEEDAPATVFVVPGTALTEVERITDETSNIAITVGEKHIMFTFGDTVLITRRLEGEFINYKNTIPQTNEIKIRVTKSQLIDAVERVSLVISDKIKSPIRCVFWDGVIKLYAMSAIGKAADECRMDGDGGGLEIGFNNRYLLEALKAAPDTDVLIELSTSTAPCVINPVEDGKGGFTYMILPVRLKAYEG